MHGLWFLLLLPLSAIMGWRLSSTFFRKAAFVLLALSFCGTLGWFGYLVWFNAPPSDPLGRRMLGAIILMASEINAPVVQVLVAIGLFLRWPAAWKYNGEAKDVGPTITVPESGVI